jgi:hypothetical protein
MTQTNFAAQSSAPLAYSSPAFAGIIGVAREDITPPVGIYARNWGAATHDVATGVHRPLTLTALTFQTDDEKPLVLIAADLGWWRSRDVEWTVRGRVLEALDLHPSRLMICFSHTHAGPVLGIAERHQNGGEFIEPYLQTLTQAAIRAAQNALQEAQLRVLDWSYGHCTLATNRDLPDPNDASGQRVLVGFNAAQKSDTTLLVGRVCEPDGKMVASLVNYACHPTTLAWDNKLISPDYVGAMRQTIEDQTQAPCLFLQGASGELAPREQYVGETSVADSHGKTLGFSALSVLQNMMPPQMQFAYSHAVESGATLAIWRTVSRVPSSRIEARCVEVKIPLKSDWPTTTQLEQQIADCGDAEEDRAERERLRRRLQTRRSLSDEASTQMPLWVWRLGDAVLVGQPNEAYSLLQTELRARFPNAAIGVMNVVNGWYGYLPPRDLYAKNIYSVWQTPFAAGGLESLISAAQEQVADVLRNS